MQTGPVSGRPGGPDAWVAVNGRILRESEARISPADRGFLYGDGLFETLKARRGQVDFLDLHLARMQEGARALRIPVPAPLSLAPLIRELLDRNDLRDTAAVKVCLSRGAHRGPLCLYEPDDPTLVVFARPWDEPDPGSWEKGLALAVEQEIRQNRFSGICGLKTLNYLPCLLARTRAVEAGFDEAILLNAEGDLCECSAANLFFFRKGRIETPETSCGLLPGIVRAVLVQMLAGGPTPVQEVRVTADILGECEEIFLTSSLLEIMPVGRVGEALFPRRDRTRALRERFRAHRDALHPPAEQS